MLDFQPWLQKRSTATVIAALGILMLIGIGRAANATVQFTKLYDFPALGEYSAGATQLTLGPDGNLYGTTNHGGANGLGTVFSVTSAGTYTTVYSFRAAGGYSLSAGLTLGSDGNFYGITDEGGANGLGTIFKITLTGAFTPVYAFSPYYGEDQRSALTLGADGAFYGTEPYAGVDGYGTIFKITPSGEFTILYTFPGTEGIHPNDLTLGSDGNLYGNTTYTYFDPYNFPDGYGTIFRITSSGAYSLVYTFEDEADGADPTGLTLDPDGSFYGSATYGPTAYGPVFKINPSGTLTPLGDYSPNGSPLFNPLTLGNDGNFYTTGYETAADLDCILGVTPTGAVTTLYTFAATNNFSDGNDPNALTLGADGALYGTTTAGGANNSGTIFKFSVMDQPAATSIAAVIAQSLRGQTVPLTATLTVTNKLSPQGKPLTFTVDGTTVGTATTNSNGVATLPFVVPTSFGLWGHKIIVTFAGDSSDTGSSGTGWLDVDNDTLTVVSQLGVPGKPSTLQANVTAVSGTIPYLSTVTFYIDGVAVGTSGTNGSGIARISWLVPESESIGVHKFYAVLSPTGSFTKCSGSGTFTVRYISAIAVQAVSGQPGTTVSLNASMTGSPGNVPAANLPLLFSIDGTPIGSKQTNQFGQAYLEYTIPASEAVGSHTITVSYMGQSFYAWATGTGTLTVN